MIAARYERGSLIVTSNLPFGQWDATFAQGRDADRALLDRLLHHARIVPIARELPLEASASGRDGSGPKGEVGG